MIVLAVPAMLLLNGCNVRGLFTKYEDDPVYVSKTQENAQQGGGAADAAAQSPGAKTFAAICATCHQTKGQGVPGTYPPLAGSALATDADASKAIRLVLHGFKGQIVRNGTTYNGVMAAWKQLTDQEIADALTHVRSSWGNSASAVTADEVKAVRDKTSARNGAYEEKELEQSL